MDGLGECLRIDDLVELANPKPVRSICVSGSFAREPQFGDQVSRWRIGGPTTEAPGF